MAAGEKLGILAGGGGVPIEVAEQVTRTGQPFHVIALRGFADQRVEHFPHTFVGLGQLGALLATLERERCKELLIIGSLARPDLTSLRFDLGALRHWRAIYSLTRGGDDRLLRRIVRFFEGQGLSVVGVRDIAPELVANAGLIAGPTPRAPAHAAIAAGLSALTQLAGLDIGQAAIATPNGLCACEDGAGTANLLARYAQRAQRAADAVVIKCAKPGQELRVDMPTIGPETLEQMARAGLATLAVSSGSTMIADRPGLRARAETLGISVIGLGDGAIPSPRPGQQVPAPAAAVPVDDSAVAEATVRVLAGHLEPAIGNWGAVVREGHVQAIEMGAEDLDVWTARVERLPRGWGLSQLLPWETSGRFAFAVRGTGSGGLALERDSIRRLAKLLKRRRFSGVTLMSDRASKVLAAGDTSGTLAQLRDSLRLAGLDVSEADLNGSGDHGCT